MIFTLPVKSGVIFFREMTNHFVEANSTSSTTPEMMNNIGIAPDQLTKEDLCVEVEKLRRELEVLSEEREGDRKSILILQEQIDSLRDSSKCSDSLETTFQLMGNLVACAWSKIPAVQLSFLQRSSKKKRYVSEQYKNSGKTLKKASSTRSTPPPCSNISVNGVAPINAL